MSRSYKHTPYCGGSDKFFKHYANRKVRRTPYEETLQHKGYRKIVDSWEIRDYYDMETFESFCTYWWNSFKRWGAYYGIHSHLYKRGTFPPKKDLYRFWYKAYKMK